MVIFSLTSYFHASKVMPEMLENMDCAKISTFTVVLQVKVTFTGWLETQEEVIG